jgi:hypothetical protein
MMEDFCQKDLTKLILGCIFAIKERVFNIAQIN